MAQCGVWLLVNNKQWDNPRYWGFQSFGLCYNCPGKKILVAFKLGLSIIFSDSTAFKTFLCCYCLVGMYELYNLGNSQQLSQVDKCQNVYLTNVQANTGQQILSKHDSPMKDFIALAWSRLQSRDKSRLPGGQIHISTCIEEVTTHGRQRGGWKLTGVLGSGERSGHTAGAPPAPPALHPVLSPLTLTGGESSRPQTPAASPLS